MVRAPLAHLRAFARRGALATLLAALAVVLASPTNTTGAPGDGGPGEILIGQYVALTGETAAFGKETDEGVRLAVEEVNAAGGLLGRKVRLVTQDDQSSVKQVAAAAEKLVATPGIVAVIGEAASVRSLVAAPIFQRAGIPMISPASTNENVTGVGNYIFRACFLDPFQGWAMARFAREELKATRAALLVDGNSGYSGAVAAAFEEEFTRRGGQVVAEEYYDPDDADYGVPLRECKAKGADVLFIPGYYSDAGRIARLARQMGISCPLLGTDGWASENIVAAAGGPGGALEGGCFSDHFAPDDPTPAARGFVKRFQAKYGGRTPGGLSALGYDALMLLADAIRRAGSAERPRVRDALARTRDCASLTGPLTIDAQRNARRPAVVLRVRGSAFVYARTIAAEGTPPPSTETLPGTATPERR